MEISDISDVLSNILNINPKYLTFPNIIFYFIIPFVAAVYFWYVLLEYKLRIFRYNPKVNAILAILISFFNVALISMISPTFFVPVMVAVAVLLGGHFSTKRAILCIAVGVFLWFLYPWMMGMFA